MSDKKIIRSTLKEKRTKLDAKQISFFGEQILQRALPLLDHDNFLLYRSMRQEVETKPLFDYLLSQGKNLYFPRVEENGMHFYPVGSLDDFSEGPWGPEPTPTGAAFELTKPGLVFVPGVAFSKTGDRLGYGKGHYDGFLSSAPQLLRVGLAYDFQIVMDTWSSEAHDQAMDLVVTPSAIWGSPRPRS